MNAANTLIAMSLAALFPAAILYFANIFAANRRLNMVSHGVTLVGWILLSAGLALRIAHDGFPFLATAFQALVFISSLLLLLHLVQILWKDLPSLGAVVVPIALAALFVATALPAPSGQHLKEIRNQWIYLHVLSIAMSMALLLLAASCAFLWLIQHHMLKRKKWSGAFRRLPPLEVLDEISYFLAAVGFAALTVGIITVIVWALTHPETNGMQDMLTRIAAGASWILYVFYIWAHSRAKWRGKPAHYILVAGCIAIILTMSLHRWFTHSGYIEGGEDSGIFVIGRMV